MRRIAFAILCSCVLAALGFPTSAARAGGYYDDGYYRHRYYDDGYYRHRYRGHVWYSSKCCYKKIIRHERSVRYVRIDRWRHHGYYGRPWRYGYYERPYRYGYYDRPYRPAYYYDAPRYYNDSYWSPGYDAYNAVSAAYTDSCYRRRVPIGDGRGGWVWGLKTNCY